MPTLPADVLMNRLRGINDAGNSVGIRLEDLARRAADRGIPLNSFPLREIGAKLMALPPQDRDYVLRQLARGEPAVVQRPLRPGESDNGDRRQLFMLVQPPPPNTNDVAAQAQAAADRFGPTQQTEGRSLPPGNAGADNSPWASALDMARKRAAYQPGPFMPGQHGSNGAGSMRDAARERMMAAFAQRNGAPQPGLTATAAQATRSDASLQQPQSGTSRAQAMRYQGRDSSAGSGAFNNTGRF